MGKFRLFIWMMIILVLSSLSGSPASAKYPALQPIGVIIFNSTPLDLLRAGVKPDVMIGYSSFSWLIYDSHPPDDALAQFTSIYSKNPFLLDLGGEVFDLVERDISILLNEDESSNQTKNLYLIQFFGPTKDVWLKEIQSTGMEIVQYIHPFTYVVWGTSSEVIAASKKSFIRAIGDFSSTYKVLPPWRNLDAGMIPIRSMVYRNANLENITTQILAHGGQITTSVDLDATFRAVHLIVPGNKLMELAKIPGLYSLKPMPVTTGVRGEISSQVNAGQIDPVTHLASPGYLAWLNTLGFAGSGIVIANVDNGINQNHPDLIDHIAPCNGATCGGSIQSDHGTHTAGIMAGDGSSDIKDTNGFLRGLGVAPEAMVLEQLYNPFYLQPNGMSQLMKESSQNGARISGNSWGPSDDPLGYDEDTRQVDAGVRDAQPLVAGNQSLTYVLSIMNGNGGTSSQGTPDEAKNAFTIGSTRMQKSNGTQTPLIDDLSSNSAHGPALDDRIIPHLVAPGCYVDSTLITGHGLMCGTSMASPQVSGAVALFMNKYLNLNYTYPSPALVKAAFLPVAVDLAGNLNADGNLMGHPFNSQQGWGRLNLAAVVAPEVPVQYYDNPLVFSNTGEVWEINLAISDHSQPVRIMLVWTDAPGHGLGGSTPAWNNNLDLQVIYDQETLWGNQFSASGFSQPGGAPDEKNNTEGVFFQPGSVSFITLRVLATNISSDGIPNHGDATDQDFALVCYNCHDPQDFTLLSSPSHISICGSGTAGFTINTIPVSYWIHPITLSVNDLPLDMVTDFSQNNQSPPFTALLSVAVNSSSVGSYNFHINGESAGYEHAIPLSLDVYSASPSSPILISPPMGSGGQPLAPEFSWVAGEGSHSFTLEIATDISLIDNLIRIEDIQTVYYRLPFPLEPETQYFWRVIPHNSCGEGAPSTIHSFTTTFLPGGCPGGNPPTVIYAQDFEATPEGWETPAGVGTNTWALSNIRAHASLSSMHAQSPPNQSDQSLISPLILLTVDQSPITLQFWNYQDLQPGLDSCMDGVLIEVSINGGEWLPLDNSWLSLPYDGVINPLRDNPLENKSAWCGFPRDWHLITISLNSFTGQAIRFRFRLGSNNAIAAEGWYIDDLSIWTCPVKKTFLPSILKH